LRRQCKEMDAVTKITGIMTRQTQVGFVDQGGRL
jgi:hypothetical protein